MKKYLHLLTLLFCLSSLLACQDSQVGTDVFVLNAPAPTHQDSQTNNQSSPLNLSVDPIKLPNLEIKEPFIPSWISKIHLSGQNDSASSHQNQVTKSSDCRDFPDAYVVSAEDEDFGICLISPDDNAEFDGDNLSFVVSGVVSTSSISDLSIRLQNRTQPSVVLTRAFQEIRFDSNTGRFATRLQLNAPGTYSLVVTAVKIPEDPSAHPRPISISLTRTLHYLEDFSLEILEPAEGQVLSSTQPVPIRVQVRSAGSALIPTRELLINGSPQEDPFTNATITGLYTGEIYVPAGQNKITVRMQNSHGTAEADVNVYNDLVGPRIVPVTSCPHFIRQVLPDTRVPISASFRIQDPLQESFTIQARLNDKTDVPCEQASEQADLYHCETETQKAGINYLDIRVKDARGNENEWLTSCIVAKDIKSVYDENGNINENTFVPNGIILNLSARLFTEKLTSLINPFINKDSFKTILGNALKSEMPSRGTFPFSKGNSSFDLNPEDIDWGPLNLEINFDPNRKEMGISLDLNHLKGHWALSTFHMQLHSDGWPKLDPVCHYPIPLDRDGDALPFPADPNRRLDSGDCLIDFDPNFAGNYCGHPIRASDPVQANRLCFIQALGKSSIPLEFKMERFALNLPIELVLQEVEPRVGINIDERRFLDELDISPSHGFIKGPRTLSDPYIRIADIDQIFKGTLVQMVSQELSFYLNQFLSTEFTSELKLDLLGKDLEILISALMPQLHLDILMDRQGNKFITLAVPVKVGNTKKQLENFFLDSTRRAAQQQADSPLDEQGLPWNPGEFGYPNLAHAEDLNPSQTLRRPMRDIHLILREEVINHALFSLALSGLMDIDYGKKFLDELETTAPDAFPPNARSMVGAGVKRLNYSLLEDNTPMVMQVRPRRSYPLVARWIDSSTLSETSLIKQDYPSITSVLELSIGDLGILIYEANQEGDLVRQPDGQKCENTTSSNCSPIVRFAVAGNLYVAFAILPTEQSPSGKNGLIDSRENPLTLLMVVDNKDSRLRVATVPGSNFSSNKTDRQMSVSLEQLLNTALGEKSFNPNTGEFENGFFPLEIPIPRDLLDAGTVLLEGNTDSSDFTLGDLGIGAMRLENIRLGTSHSQGILEAFTNLEILATAP